MCRIEPKPKQQDGGGGMNPGQKDYGCIINRKRKNGEHQMTVAILKSISNPLSQTIPDLFLPFHPLYPSAT
jgi:hypothetical protein